MATHPNDNAKVPEQQLSVTSLKYLKQHGFDAEMIEQCVQNEYLLEISKQKAEQYLHREMADGKIKWSGYLWTPRVHSSGEIELSNGRIIRTAKIAFVPDAITTSKSSPASDIAPNHVSFYGDDWTDYDGKIWIHESNLKALLHHCRTGAHTIGLNGIDGYITNKSVVDDIYSPVWSTNAEAYIVFDSPHIGDDRSREGIARSKKQLAAVLEPNFAAVYDASLPPSEMQNTSWDVNDYFIIKGDKAFELLERHAVLLHEQESDQQSSILLIGDLIKEDPPKWAVYSLIPCNEITMILGAYSTGKSFLTMDLLLAMSGNRKQWFGLPVRTHGLTVHVTLEGSGMRERAMAYLQTHPDVTDPKHVIIRKQINFRSPGQVDEFIADINDLCQQHKVPLAAIAIDTVNRAMFGGDENSSSDMGEFLTQLERLKITFPDSAIIIVHHPGKNESAGGRGHSSLTANIGTILKIQRLDNSDDEDAMTVRTIRVEKQREGRDGYEVGRFNLPVVDVGKDGDDVLTSCVVNPLDRQQQEKDKVIQTHAVVYDWWEAGGKQDIFLTKASRNEDLHKRLKDDGVSISMNRLKTMFGEFQARGWMIESGSKRVFTMLPIPGSRI